MYGKVVVEGGRRSAPRPPINLSICANAVGICGFGIKKEEPGIKVMQIIGSMPVGGGAMECPWYELRDMSDAQMSTSGKKRRDLPVIACYEFSRNLPVWSVYPGFPPFKANFFWKTNVHNQKKPVPDP